MGSDILQGDPLEHLGLRRIAVDSLGQQLKRHFVSNRQSELADHFAGMRRNERCSKNLAAAATGINRRKPLLLAVDKGAFHLGQLKPILIDGDALFSGPEQVRTASKEFRQKVQRMTRRRSLLVNWRIPRGDCLLNDAVSFGARGS